MTTVFISFLFLLCAFVATGICLYSVENKDLRIAALAGLVAIWFYYISFSMV